jgi:hypothetical protein
MGTIIMSRKKTNYPETIQARVSSAHISVIKEYMRKYEVSKTEAIRMIIDASARYLFDDE